jgi:hypothetical protein
MEQKKETRATIERKIKNAVVFVPRTKNTLGVFFSDKGLRLTVNEDYAIVATGFHRHVFNNFTNAGISRPYLYTKRVIEITNEHLEEIKTDNGYSFQRLLEVLKAKEDKSEYNIVTYVSWWLEIIFAPLYSIDESEAGSFLVYEAYLHHIARQAVLLSEKKEDMTNKQFFDDVIKNMQDFIEGVDERVIFHKMTDEEMAQANIEALAQNEQEQAMEAQINGASKD